MASKKKRTPGSTPQNGTPIIPDYQELRRELARIGYLVKGSVQVRRMLCGQAACRCRQNPRYRHGPYYWWTSKVGGKTVTAILPKEEGELYLAWAKNRQRLEALLEKMYQLSARVAKGKFRRPPPSLRGR
jgi:hypothetical protein